MPPHTTRGRSSIAVISVTHDRAPAPAQGRSAGLVGTMRAMAHGPPDSLGRQWVHAGQRQPLVVVFTRPTRSYSALNFGQSNNPTSPHCADQSRLIGERRLKPTYFAQVELAGHVTTRRTLDGSVTLTPTA